MKKILQGIKNFLANFSLGCPYVVPRGSLRGDRERLRLDRVRVDKDRGIAIARVLKEIEKENS